MGAPQNKRNHERMSVKEVSSKTKGMERKNPKNPHGCSVDVCAFSLLVQVMYLEGV